MKPDAHQPHIVLKELPVRRWASVDLVEKAPSAAGDRTLATAPNLYAGARAQPVLPLAAIAHGFHVSGRDESSRTNRAEPDATGRPELSARV